MSVGQIFLICKTVVVCNIKIIKVKYVNRNKKSNSIM